MTSAADGARFGNLRRNYMRISAKHSLLLLFAALASSAGLSLASYRLLVGQLDAELNKRGWNTARHLAYTVAPLILGNDLAKIQAAAQNVLEEPDIVHLAVVDHQGQKLASGGQAPEGDVQESPSSRPWHRSERSRKLEVFYQPAQFGGVLVGGVRVAISRRSFENATTSLAWSVLGIGLAVTALVALISFLLLRRTLRPLSQVLEGTRRIAEGDFSARIETRARDELGELGRAFNLMAARTGLFFRYVDKTVAERLAHDESLARPGGSMKPVSVLFGDMRGFTELANRRDPSDVVWILNNYFDLFFRIVHRYGGIIDKTMGDALMAFFEPASTIETAHSLRAALAASLMRAVVWMCDQLARECRGWGWKLAFEPRNFGFSVATGRLIVGNVGSTRKMDYTVCGPAVNLAARLLEDTPRGELLLDRFTAMDVENELELRQKQTIQPKGFGPHQLVTPYQVIQIKEHRRPLVREQLLQLFDERTLSRLYAPAPEGTLNKSSLQALGDACSRLVAREPPEFLVG